MCAKGMCIDGLNLKQTIITFSACFCNVLKREIYDQRSVKYDQYDSF